MFSKVFEGVIQCFGAAITKKTAFFPKKWPKNAILKPKTAFWGPEWSVVGPHTLYSGCWTQQEVFHKVLEQKIKGLRAAITTKGHFLATNGQKKPSFGLKQCFWGLSGHR